MQESAFPTKAQFAEIFPKAPPGAYESLQAAAAKYEINNPNRIASFLSQLSHESIGLTHMVENLTFSESALAKTWPVFRKDPALAKKYAMRPEALANFIYGNRMGNGPEASGDGWRYRGRSWIMLTGAENYSRIGGKIGVDLRGHPELASTVDVSGLICGQYWEDRGINRVADLGDVSAVTWKINGGAIGLEERKALYSKVRRILGVGF